MKEYIGMILFCMFLLTGCGEKQSDAKLSDVVMSEADITFGEYRGYSIKLIMTEGDFYTDTERAPAGGVYEENYDGEYCLQVLNADGEIVDWISLNEDWGYDTDTPPLTINFPGKFELCVGDYNQDGYPDFTIGTYGSSSMNIFELYSVDAAGKIKNIGSFADSSKEFSIYPKQEDGSTDLYTTVWNNAIGEAVTIRWVWNQEAEKYEEGAAETNLENVEDYSEIFGDITGCAVLYVPEEDSYTLYHQELCETEVSPYSTFKIITALMGLNENIIVDAASTMNYNGTQYNMQEWNANLTLKEAFQTSCIWYFRQVIDELGAEKVKASLEELHYGNCDITEWEGSNINSLPELNGFWLGSSLQISPREWVEVLTAIFEGETAYREEDILILKDMMLVEAGDAYSVYGKTGTGTDGRAWFVGFMEEGDKRTYFAVYLEDKENGEQISGKKAKELTFEILQEKREKQG